MAKTPDLEDILKKYEAETTWADPKKVGPKPVLAQKPIKSEEIAAPAGRSLPKLEDVDKRAVLAVLDAIANVDPLTAFDDYGAVLPIAEMPVETRAAIRSIKVKEIFERVGTQSVKVGEVKEVQFWDKLAASEMLGKYKKMFTDQPPQQVNNILIVDSLKRGLERLQAVGSSEMPSDYGSLPGGAQDHEDTYKEIGNVE
jgi:hypothetical protein